MVHRTFAVCMLAATAVLAGEPVPRLIVTGPTLDDDGMNEVATFGIEVLGAGESSGPIDVELATVACTARAGEDFVARTGSITIPAGVESWTVPVELVAPAAGSAREGFETFRIELSNVVGADILDGVGEAVLRDVRPVWPSTPGDADHDGDADLWIEYGMVDGRPRKKVIAHGVHGTSATALCELGELVDPADWRAAAVEDVDGDGYVDVLWWHPAGEIGFTVAGGLSGTLPLCGPGFDHVLPTIQPGQPDSPETFVGTGRFSGRGLDVVRFEDESREIRLWAYDAALDRVPGFDPVIGVAPDVYWRPVGVGDFDGDGDSDLVLRNSFSGRYVIWHYDGMVRVGGGYLLPDAPATGSWAVVATGDYNGDGQSDLLLRDGDGEQMKIWFVRHRVKVCEAAITPDLDHPDEVESWSWSVLR